MEVDGSGSSVEKRVVDQFPAELVADSNLGTFVAESISEGIVSLIPGAGPLLVLAWEKVRSRQAAKKAYEIDLFLYSLGLSLQAQLDELGAKIDSIEECLRDPQILDLIARGVDASAEKTEPEITLLAEAVARAIGTGDPAEDVAALLDIIGRLRHADIAVLRSLVGVVRPGDYGTLEEISEILGIGALGVQASLLRLEGAGLVVRSVIRAGKSSWTPVHLGVQVATALGETNIRTLPRGWTSEDVEVLEELVNDANATPLALRDLADRLGRTEAELDASSQILERAGYLQRRMTIGSPYARYLILDDSAYLWQSEQDPDGLHKILGKLHQALLALPDNQHVGSDRLARELGLQPRLVQALLRKLEATGYVTQLSERPTGPLFSVVPTAKLRRADRLEIHQQSG